MFDVLVAEIGSTMTKVHAVGGMDGSPRLVAQGFAPTTVDEGDVMIGLEQALADLARVSGGGVADAARRYANSSAAGGLRMSAHGLTYDMTLRAAREACLGAGAVLRYVTAGRITDRDLRHLDREQPKIILLAGGVDFGESEIVCENARQLTRLECRPPVVYAGNAALAGEVGDVLSAAGFRVFTAPNVYPRVDELNPEPVRRLVREIFSHHIVTAPGIEGVRQWAHGEIMPTPGAVLIAAELLAKELGPLVVLDVGGATTDVHSVSDPTPEIAAILVDPVPRSRRTVEGDLGVFRNARHVLQLMGRSEAEAPRRAVPASNAETELFRELARKAAETGLERHAGEVRSLYTVTGPKRIAQGTDLTGVAWIIGTGGPLTRLPGAMQILESLRQPEGGPRLMPGPGARVAIDSDYILSACGTMGLDYPGAACELAVSSIRRTAGL
jgi:hypothetical protein